MTKLKHLVFTFLILAAFAVAATPARAACSVSGTIFDGQGTTLSDVDVTFCPVINGSCDISQGFTVKSDATTGVFTADSANNGLQCGVQYLVQPFVPGYRVIPVYQFVTPADGEDITGLDFTAL